MAKTKDWRKVKLGDVVDFNPTISLKKGTVAKYIEMANLAVFQRQIQNFEMKAYNGGSKFQNNDTLLARITPCLENGKTAFVNILENDEVAFGSTEYIILRAINKITDPKFIYYLAISQDFRNIAINSMNGSSGRQRVQTDVLKSHECVLPPLEEQEHIAEILSSFDDKIENNKKICSTLEDMARLLFRENFINNPQRATWGMGKLGDIFPVITGKQNGTITIDNGLYPFFSCSQKSSLCNQYSFDNSAILLAGNGDFNVKWYRGKFEAYQRTYVLIPYDSNLLFFFYLLIDNFLPDLVSGHRGSVINFITKGMVEKFSFHLPNKKLLDQYIPTINTLFSQIENLQKEIITLTTTRDILLPRLMKGEV